jgi:hypothetical protein
VVLLQGPDLQRVPSPVGDAGGGGPRCRDRGDARHAVGRRRLADVGTIGAGPSTPRRVHDDLNLAALDEIHDICPVARAGGHERIGVLEAIADLGDNGAHRYAAIA